MNDSERRYYERHVRVKQFGTDNAGDFGGIGSTTFTDHATLTNEIEAMGASQQAGVGTSSQEFEQKDTARELLRDLMSEVARTARSMEYQYDGIADLFRFQRNMTDVDLLNRARAFITNAAPYSGPFKDYKLSDDIVAELTPLADNFEASFGELDSAVADRVEAGANLAAKIRAANVKVRILDGIVKNTYANNPGKLAAWVSASHVEKPPTKKTP